MVTQIGLAQLGVLACPLRSLRVGGQSSAPWHPRASCVRQQFSPVRMCWGLGWASSSLESLSCWGLPARFTALAFGPKLLSTISEILFVFGCSWKIPSGKSKKILLFITCVFIGGPPVWSGWSMMAVQGGALPKRGMSLREVGLPILSSWISQVCCSIVTAILVWKLTTQDARVGSLPLRVMINVWSVRG